MAPAELGAEAAALCTVITTTSPTPSNPSTELISETLRTVGEHAPELLSCRNIIVCDGYRSGASSKFRCGVVTEERAAAYAEYVEALQRLVNEDNAPHWRQAQLLRLEDRHGFGFAVRAALALVKTPFVFVLQHDRTFMRPFALSVPLMRAMTRDRRLKMVGLPTTTNDPLKYVMQAQTKLGEMKVPDPPRLETTTVAPFECPGVRLIPLIMWHDSSHFASTEYYRDFVFGPRDLVSRGGFIEDKLGQQQGNDLRTKGWSSHAEYGTWLLDDGAPAPSRMVGHLDGKHFLRRAEKEALLARGRAAVAAAPGRGEDGAADAAARVAPSTAKPCHGASPAAAEAIRAGLPQEELRAPLFRYLMLRPGSV